MADAAVADHLVARREGGSLYRSGHRDHDVPTDGRPRYGCRHGDTFLLANVKEKDSGSQMEAVAEARE